MDGYIICQYVSLFLIVVGMLTYFYLYSTYRVLREDKTTSEAIIDIISHVPEAGARPGPHILAGVSLVCGVSLSLAAMISDIVAPAKEFVAYLVSLSSLMIAAAFSSISMWTLWQARRLEFQAGYKIHDFYQLISKLNCELELLLSSLRGHYQMKSQPFHRVYLITTQPFLGMLSYPNSDATNKFKGLVHQCADAHYKTVFEYNHKNCDSYFDFHILCGDNTLLKNFHEKFYDNKSGYDEKKIISLSQEVEKEIQDINDRAERANGVDNRIKKDLGPFHRVKVIPSVQFMVIGNKLFEFTLEAGNSQSEIFNTQVVHDSRYCESYINNFRLFLRHLK